MSTAKFFLRIGIIICSLAIMTTITPNALAQGEDHTINTSLTHDFAGNLTGGMRTGQAHMGLINLDFSLDSRSLNLWDNGLFRIHIQNTYGQKPTQNLIGDIQVFSNIENGTYTYLYQFWYKHRIGDFSIIAGKHDLNEVFFTSEFAGEYINSSFGIMPIASLNVPVSIFPRTTLGIIGKYKINSKYEVYAGIYNGRPGALTQSNFGTDFNLSLNHGRFYVGEFHIYSQIGDKAGNYKIGGFYHSDEFSGTIQPSQPQKGVGGIYFIADQMIFQNSSAKNSGLGALLQLGYAPGRLNINDFYLAGGFNYSGLFTKQDKMGLALAHASANKSSPSLVQEDCAVCETTLELTYKTNIMKNLVIQPDLQYIIHPGIDTGYDNALAGLLRIHWSLN